MMGLDKDHSDNDVLFCVPRGTVVAMDKVALGEDGKKSSSHFVKGAAGTYATGIELGIGEDTEEDCEGCCKEDKV